ncbi:MAG: hypothetical protein WB697_13875 [Stellaceae bacterium]
MSRSGVAALACVFVLLLAGMTSRAETPFYLGDWTIASVEPGVWTTGYYEADKLTELRKLVGAPIIFGPRSVEGPPPIACPRAQYGLDGATAHDLFDGRLEKVWSSPTPSPDESDPSGEYFAPEVLAARLGFRGFSWKALTTGCAMDGTGQIHFSSPNNAAFRIGDFVVTIKRK